MNRIFRVVWNQALGAWTVASEHAAVRGKSGRRRGATRMRLPLLLLLPAIATAADLPSGGSVVAGSGSISSPSSERMVIEQTSSRLAIDWRSFDIGSGHTVSFVQPGADAIVLNRVTGSDASRIYGTLEANGRVFLVNPNGILFGSGASVNVGSLVASTLELSDEDFLAGRYRFKGGGSAGVVNQGAISAADGGAVALLGGSVSNQGTIVANLGSVVLAAGSAITLDFAGDGLLSVQVDEGTADALVENQQLIQADGGSVIMTARASDALLRTVVNNTGVIEARSLASGETGTIVLLGGDSGSVQVAGTLDASAPDGGDGGFIETSGAHVKVIDGAIVTTLAASGATGEWLIDPTDFTISAGSAAQTDSGIGADTLASALASSNVTLETASSGSDAGDIDVDAAVSWSASTTLTLTAANDINLNAAISASNGGLTLSAGNAISASAAVDVDTFTLQSGAWVQNADGGTLPGFSADDFRLSGGSFLRVQDGDGSSADPYRIVDVYGLQGIGSASAYLSAYWALGSDIDASGTANWNCDNSGSCAGFDPIGDSSTAFSGNLDGQGHSISGLTISRSGTDYVGLFGYVGAAGTVYDLGLEGGSIAGANDVGGIAGQSEGTLTNVWNTGTVVGTGSYVGGLVGANDGTIEDAYATGAVSGSGSDTGGLVGYNRGSVSGAYATGDVSGRSYSGGLVGRNDSQISDSYATGDVISDTRYAAGIDYVGGLAGYNAGTISGSHASGNVSGRYSVGGLVGFNYYGSVSQSYATGEVTALGYAGGLVGQNGSGSISQSYASGEVSVSASYAGGLVGMSTNGSIDQSYATGAVSGSSDIGGLLGYGYNVSISESYATGAATGSSYVGGLVGYFYSGTITSSFWNTDATATGLGYGSSSGAIGKTLAELQTLSTFTDAGWDIDDAGGTGLTWRIYEGNTTPLLRSFLTTLAVTATPDYDGSGAALDNIASVTWSSSGADSSHLFGSTTSTDGDTLTLTSTADGEYTATSNATATGTLYSDQQGYDIVYGGIVSRTISTPGSTAGDIQLPSSITWSSGTLVIDTSGSLTTGDSGTLTTAIDGDTFRLQSGTWSQNAEGGTLADFSVADFGLDTANATFLRVLDGDGSADDPYQIVDVYGLQGIASSSLLGYSYVLNKAIDASGTANWNCDDSGDCEGFDPIGDSSTPFTGNLDGQNHVISGLTLNRSDSESYVGLFGYVGSSGSIANLGLEGGSVSGGNYVGGLAGYNAGSITDSYASGDVQAVGASSGYGSTYLGGLAGRNSGTIAYSYATGDVSGEDGVGGLVGRNDGSIAYSYASGAVAGNDGVGGLVGRNDGSIGASYATGAVTGGTDADGVIGGLVGYNNDGTVEDSYAMGTVSGDGIAGGLVGWNGGTVENSFYATTDASGADITAGLTDDDVARAGTAKTYAELTNLSTFTDAGWDIDGEGGTGAVWRIYEGGTTPLLRHFLTAVTVSTDASASKTYDGSAASGSLDSYTAALADGSSANASLIDGTLTYATGSANVGSYTLADGTLSLSGLYSSQQGYDISYAGNASYVIDPATLTIIASDAGKTYGQAASLTGYSVSGLVNGDAVSSIDLTSAGAASTATVGNYAITAANAEGTGLSNYDITYVDGTLTVGKARLTITANDAGKRYDGLAWSGGNGVGYNGFVNGEDAAALGGTLVYGGTSQGAIDAGRYTITAGGLSSDNYAIDYVDGLLTIQAASAGPVGPQLPPGYAAALASAQRNGQRAVETAAADTPYLVVADGIRLPWSCTGSDRSSPGSRDCIQQGAQ